VIFPSISLDQVAIGHRMELRSPLNYPESLLLLVLLLPWLAYIRHHTSAILAIAAAWNQIVVVTPLDIKNALVDQNSTVNAEDLIIYGRVPLTDQTSYSDSLEKQAWYCFHHLTVDVTSVQRMKLFWNAFSQRSLLGLENTIAG
jgi:hypothetical protein